MKLSSQQLVYEKKKNQNICSWYGAHLQQMIFDTFSGAWGSFNLKKKNSWTENIFQSRSFLDSSGRSKESE